MKIALLVFAALLAGGCATAPLAARQPLSLYCDGYLSADGDFHGISGVAALLQISANQFTLDIDRFGHGDGRGKLKRKGAFELSGPVLFTASEAGADAREASLVLRKYSGQLVVRMLGTAISATPLYSGECKSQQPIVDSAD